VRAVVDKLSTFNGIFAANHTSMFDLLRSVGEAVHALVATAVGKSRPATPVVGTGMGGAGGGVGGGGAGALASPLSPSLLALTQGQDAPASPGAAFAPPTPTTPVAGLTADAAYDAAYAILTNNTLILDVPGLQSFMQDNGYVRETMDVWEEADVVAIGAYLKPMGKRAFETKWRAART
jgi:hypothetical protein